MTPVRNLDCMIQFPDATEFSAAAQLAECEIGNHKFWFGVARVVGLNQELPGRFRMMFGDGRSGAATSGACGAAAASYVEVSFLGLTELA